MGNLIKPNIKVAYNYFVNWQLFLQIDTKLKSFLLLFLVQNPTFS